jgi:hypothetical protein
MERPQRKHETTTHRSKDKNKKLFSTQFRIQPTTFLHSIPLSFHVYTTTHSSPPFPLHNPLPMQTILQMLLEVLDHAQRQRRVNLARTIHLILGKNIALLPSGALAPGEGISGGRKIASVVVEMR